MWRENREKGEEGEGKKRGKENQRKKYFWVFSDRLCVGALLEHVARPLTTLPSLSACAEPKGQPEMKPMVFSCLFWACILPWELFKALFSQDSHFPFFFSSLAFGISVVCFIYYLLPQVALACSFSFYVFWEGPPCNCFSALRVFWIRQNKCISPSGNP